MAINNFLTDSNPMISHSEYALTQESTAIIIPTQPPSLEFCFCDYECNYEELVLANDGVEDFENDKTSFLYERVDTTSGTITFTLIDSNGVEYPLNSTTYGEYYDFGSFTDHPQKKGFIIEWYKVLTILGGGRYQVRIDVNNFSRPIEILSHYYRLRPYSERAADGTIRIKTIHDGFIQGGEDYTNMEWLKMVRIKGKVFEVTPILETDNYEDSQRKINQIQDKVYNEYSLELQRISGNLGRSITHDGILANKIYLNDYNLWSHEIIRDLEVYPTEISEKRMYTKSRRGTYILKFQDKKQDNIKRNVQ